MVDVFICELDLHSFINASKLIFYTLFLSGAMPIHNTDLNTRKTNFNNAVKLPTC